MSCTGVRQWNEDRPKQAFKLALLGASDKEIADFFECNVQTIEYWKRTKTKFRDALKRGRMHANSEVAYAGYKKATGFEYEEEHLSYVKGVPQVTTVKRYMPPDTMAIFKWLAIKGRDQGWANVNEGPKADIRQLNILNVGKLDLSKFTTDQLKVIEQLGIQNMLEQDAGNGG